jgi:hypothetical protein
LCVENVWHHRSPCTMPLAVITVMRAGCAC